MEKKKKNRAEGWNGVKMFGAEGKGEKVDSIILDNPVMTSPGKLKVMV